MGDILAIVSKAVFEKDARVAGKVVGPGDVWAVDRYNSANKGLASLKDGGRIFLVTVRPPDEQLWLVGVVDSPAFDGSAWVSTKPNTIAVTNITALRKTLVFDSGKGMSQDKGALGMSLQTPRTLTASDVGQILAVARTSAVVGAAAPAQAAPAPTVDTPAAALLRSLASDPKDEALRERVARELMAMGALAELRVALQGVAHLNAHDPSGLPCLCKRCWELSTAATEQGGMTFTRDLVLRQARMLLFWAPAELSDQAVPLRSSVRASLARRLEMLARNRKRMLRSRPEF
jgi:hypothetical protein